MSTILSPIGAGAHRNTIHRLQYESPCSEISEYLYIISEVKPSVNTVLILFLIVWKDCYFHHVNLTTTLPWLTQQLCFFINSAIKAAR